MLIPPKRPAFAGGSDATIHIEICTAGDECEAHAKCVEARGAKGEHLVSVCDPRGLARELLGVTAPGILLLLDDTTTIVDYGNLKDFDRLHGKAEQMARDARRQRDARACDSQH